MFYSVEGKLRPVLKPSIENFQRLRRYKETLETSELKAESGEGAHMWSGKFTTELFSVFLLSYERENIWVFILD